jgi:predicted transcriptional regulator
MVRVLVRLAEETMRQMEKVAPGSSRKRSRFIRLAIQRALVDLEETSTREAYLRWPDDEPAYFNPRTWEAAGKTPGRR